jgi:ribosomal protein L7/L12
MLAALRLGKTIEAIRLLRESSGLGLKEEKDVVEQHLRRAFP